MASFENVAKIGVVVQHDPNSDKCDNSNNDKYLSVLSSEGFLVVYDLETGSTFRCENVSCCLWSEDDTRLLACTKSGGLTIYQRSPRNTLETQKTLGPAKLIELLLQRNLDYTRLSRTKCVYFSQQSCILETSPSQLVSLVWNGSHPAISWDLQFDKKSHVSPSADGLYFLEHDIINRYSLDNGILVETIDLSVLGLDISFTSIQASSSYLALLSQCTVYILHKKSGNWQIAGTVTQPGYTIQTCKFSNDCLFFSCQNDLERVFVHEDWSTENHLQEKLLIPSSGELIVHHDTALLMHDGQVYYLHKKFDLNFLSSTLETGENRQAVQLYLHSMGSHVKALVPGIEVLYEYLKAHQSSFASEVLELSMGCVKKVLSCPDIEEDDSLQLLRYMQLLQKLAAQSREVIDKAQEKKIVKKWERWNDDAIIQDAISSNLITLAQSTLMSRGRKEWVISQRVRQLAKDMIQSLALRKDGLQEAEKIMRNLGWGVNDTWINLLLMTKDAKSREVLEALLAERSLVTPRLKDALQFLSLLRHTKYHAAVLNDVVNWDEKKRQRVSAEIYLDTQDEQLLERMTPEVYWSLLLERCEFDKIREWIDTAVSQDGTPLSNKPTWPITEAMIDLARNEPEVLNHLAKYGIFHQNELDNVALLIRRLKSLELLKDLRRVLSSPVSNTTFAQFLRALILLCIKKQWTSILHNYVPLWREELQQLKTECGLASSLLAFADWEALPHQIETIGDLVYHSWLGESDDLDNKPYISALLLVLQSLCPQRSVWVEDSVLWNEVLTSFWLRWACQPGVIACPALEEHLELVPVVKSFWERWKGKTGTADEWPHFSHATMSAEYGFGDALSYLYYLQQSRPASAFARALKDHSSDWSKATRFRIAQNCHGLAMANTFSNSITGACLAFLEFTGHDSTPLKCTLEVLQTIWQHGLNELTERGEKRLQKQTEWEQEINSLGRALVTERQRVGPRLLSMLVDALLSEDGEDLVAETVRWRLAVQFAKFYELPSSEAILKRFAERGQALSFLLCSQWYQYPRPQVLAASESFVDLIMKDNVQRILSLEPELASKYVAGEEVTSTPNEKELGKDNVYSIVVRCQSLRNTQLALLEEGVARRNLDLIIIATFEVGEEFSCFIAYLCVSVNRVECYKPSMPLEELENILEIVTRENKMVHIESAFKIFYPGHPLAHILDLLLHKRLATTDSYERFTDSLKSLPAESGFWDRNWCESIAWRLVDWTLFYGLNTAQAKISLLRKLCRIEEISASRPGYKRALTLVECVSPLGIDIKIAALQDPNNLAYQCEALSVVRQLTERFHFSVAQEFAALAGLSPESIILHQLSMACEQTLISESEPLARCRFWQTAYKQLKEQKVTPLVAEGFFDDHVAKAQSCIEKFVILYYILYWRRQQEGFSNKQDSIQLEKEMWSNRLHAEEHFQPEEEFVSSKLLKAYVATSAVRFRITDFNTCALNQVLNQYLDVADLGLALRLSAACDYEHCDTSLLLLMLSIAEEEPVASLKDDLQRRADLTFIKGDRKERLALVRQLLTKVRHGKQLAQKIYSGLAVAIALDLRYQYLLQHPHPESILKMILDWEDRETANTKIQLARDWILAVDLREEIVTDVLYEELIATAQKTLDPSQESNMLLSFLQGQNQRLISLCTNPSRIGQRLLDTLPQLALGIRVEVLIMAHNCFSLSCDTEGIGNVLRLSRTLVHQLKDEQEWSLMVRLLTGIQRYTEMNYVFEILQENDRFELLLRRGLDRLPLLKVALLDFLRRNSAEDRELFRLVALHFHMYDQVATLWKEDGDKALQQICYDVKLSSDGFTLEFSKPLRNAMQCFGHAAEFFAQAGKLLHAQKCISQAELTAVQLSLLSSSQRYSVLELSPSQLNSLASTLLTYPQAVIVSKAYGYKLDWGLVIYRRFVVEGDELYLAHLRKNIPCLLSCMDDVISHVDRTLSSEGLSRLGRLVTLLPYIDVQYRLASKLGLKDIVERLLNSPNACYLQDTVFKTGNQVDN